MDDQQVIAALQAKCDGYFGEIAVLDQKREEIAGLIAALHTTLGALDKRMAHPTSVKEILLLAGNHKPRATIKLKRSELNGLIRQVLMSAIEGLKTDEIADLIGPQKDIAPDDEASMSRLRRDLSVALKALTKQNIVRAEKPHGRKSYRWSLISRPNLRAV